ncbi:MAG: phosphotransferase, partial [Chloroflexales bacterium]|nr:phosphotransferase [Chloroflexales bacterium]
LPDDLRAPLAAALAHPAWRPARPRPVHGDAGLHNILWGPAGLALLDWELAGWGDPRLDLAWVAWTIRFRGLPVALWDALLAGYGRERATALGLDEEVLRALALGQVAALLARAAGRAKAWEEWLRRTRWTLHLNQIASG